MATINVVNNPPRRLQQVSTIATRKLIITWMVQDETINGQRGLYMRTINAYPMHFRGQRSANLMRASRWWAQRDKFCNEGEQEIISSPISCSRGRLGGLKQLHTKAASGRGHKRSEWVQWLYPILLDAFERFKKSGVKFSARLLIELAMTSLLDSTSPYTTLSRDPRDNVLLIEKLTNSWLQQFMFVHNIVLLSQSGRLTCSPQKEREIEMHTAFHLGVLHRGFSNGTFDENLMENIDETHFVVNMNNGRTLGFRGDTTVSYAEVVSGGDSMTMVIRISGGRRSMIEVPMLIFTNSNGNYPIRGLDDNIPGVCYRTGPKGWMDQTLFAEYFFEPRAFQSDVHGRSKVVWVDNCAGHNMTPQLSIVLEAKQTILKYLPPCSTHLCQPADTFIISKVKDAWTRRWEAKKIDLIEANNWQNTPRTDGHWSGKLINPGKRFFLQLAADSVEDVNREVDCDHLSYARKATIRSGMSLAIDGTWSVHQLFPHLQDIIGKYPQIFEGQSVPSST